MANVVSFYLYEIGLRAQAKKTEQLIARVPATRCVYAYDYKLPELIDRRKPRNEKLPGQLISATLRAPEWWQDDDLPF